MLFKELAEQWVRQLDKRLMLGKIKPASVAAFTSRVRLHALPALGDLNVQDIRNGVVRKFAESMAAMHSPKTVRENVLIVKMILQSHVDQDGEPLLDLSKWRDEFIYSNCEDLDVRKQRRQTIDLDSINLALKNRKIKVMYRVFVALAASTGMRVGEMLSLRYAGDNQSSSWDPSEQAIFVRKSVWAGKEQAPKTPAAVRRIDLSSPVNKTLSEYVSMSKKAPGDYLFSARPGLPLGTGTINKIVHQCGIPGAHSLRRARARWLDTQGCPRNLLKEWLGHSLTADISDLYIGTAELEFRRKQAERIGTGLELASATLPQSGVEMGRPRKPKRRPDTAPVEEHIYEHIYEPQAAQPEPAIPKVVSDFSESEPSPESLVELEKMRAQLEALR